MVREPHDDPGREPGYAIEDLPVAVGENLGPVLFGGSTSVARVVLTINIWVLDCELDNYVCAHVGTPQLFVVTCVRGSCLRASRPTGVTSLLGPRRPQG